MITSGDDAVDRIISSGILKRLKTLDIAYGNLSDEAREYARRVRRFEESGSAERVAKCPHTCRHERATRYRVQIVADEQHEADDGSYLYEVDRE